MNQDHLRKILLPHIEALKDYGPRHTFPEIFNSIGLSAPGSEGSKRDALRVSFKSLPDAELPAFADRFLKLHPPSTRTINQIQDVLWSDYRIEIPKKLRREIARSRLRPNPTLGFATP